MENNFFSGPIVLILIGVLLLPLALRMLEWSIPLLRERATACFPVLRDWMRRTFRWSGQLVTDEDALSPVHAVTQSAGAVAMIAFAVVYTVCELQFTWATLCPMFGGECTGETFAGFDSLLAFSTICLAIEFGLIITDLLDVTYTRRALRVSSGHGCSSWASPCCVVCCR
ncbi:MAG: hypothetical protein AB7P69_11370 [Candidatus Binatia bacterium]